MVTHQLTLPAITRLSPGRFFGITEDEEATINEALDAEESDQPVLHTNCLRCGRGLSNKQSMQRGFGPVCWTKIAVAP